MQPHDREDARADIVADIIAGKLRRESVRTRAARYAQAYAPQFGSLDAPIEPGSDLTFRDTITADPDFEAWCCA